MDSLDWTAEQLFDLVQEQLHKGNITHDDVLAAMGDMRPVKIVARGDIGTIAQEELEKKGVPISKLADVVDATIAETEGNLSPDEVSWDGIRATVEAIIQEDHL